MAIISDALRQAFMPKHEYESLRDEDRVWLKLQRPVLSCFLALIVSAIVVSVYICLSIVFPVDVERRPFCGGLRLQPLPVGRYGRSGPFRGVFVLTDKETVDYFWVVVFLPSVMCFRFRLSTLLQVLLLLSQLRLGVNGCMWLRITIVLREEVVLLTLGSNCSVPLFWCYEVASWGLVILFGGTTFFLRRKAAQILDEYRSPSSRFAGLELLETNSDVVITPDVERRVHESFKSWMGSSILSSDDEDEPDQYGEAPHATTVSSAHERV
ncbi:unnamed protein product [Rhodiola kirilowii]